MTKKCFSCKAIKSAEEFNHSSKTRDCLQDFCRNCQREHAQKNYRYNKDDIILQVLSWQFDNLEKVRAYKRKYKEYEKEQRKINSGRTRIAGGSAEETKENQ